MSIYDKLHEDSDGHRHEPAIMTARHFLSLDGTKGYTNPEEFLAYAKSLRPTEIDNLSQTFSMVGKNLRVENHTSSRKDRVNREYIFPKFLLPKSSQGYKVIAEAGMKEFLCDYAEGKVIINFSLEELVEEALNS